MESIFHRRDLLKSLTVVAFGALQLPAAEPGKPLFFSKDDFALLDAVTELIIPADDHSPGAHAAGVAVYIDKTVAEAFLPEQKTSWTKGLASVNELSQQMHRKPFLDASQEQQTTVLSAMSKQGENGAGKDTEAQKFWGQLKQTTAFAYYTSSIGIHQDINYLGNQVLEHFVGYEVS